eukprot:scaffold16761_cov60-Attheya_sp.AAC.1
MYDHITAQHVEVHQDSDVGTSGVENGADHDSMLLATNFAEADKETAAAGPPSKEKHTLRR